jgi:DNA polymerase-3 subunit gamma/tau
LATTELHKVPETIISRCQVFNLRRISQQWIINRLKYVCDQEKFTYEDGALELIARVVDGGMRDALKYLEQLSTFGNITYWLAEQMLWVTSSQTLSNLLSNYVKQDREAMNQTISQLNHQWSDASAVIKDLVRYIDTNSTSFEDIKKNSWLLWVCFEYLRTSRWQSFPWLYFSYLLSEHTK